MFAYIIIMLLVQPSDLMLFFFVQIMPLFNLNLICTNSNFLLLSFFYYHLFFVVQ